MAVQPWFSVYRAGDLSIGCFRAVRANPAQPGDFISYAELGASYRWWMEPLAIGISAWEDPEKAEALAARKGYPLLAELDLVRVDPKASWARTFSAGHVTIWASATLLLQGVVSYAEVR